MEGGSEEPVFNPRRCYAKSVWCGTGPVPSEVRNNTIYQRQGSPYECLKKGVGTGVYEERRKGLVGTSLLKMKYVTEAHEQNFIEKHILTQQDLVRFASLCKISKLRKFLGRCLVDKIGRLDERAYNSVVLFLYLAGVSPLPECVDH
jgi:hypothetical protein